MGREPKTETRAEQQSSVAIVKSFYLTLLKKCRSAQAAIDEEKASLGGMISDAVENRSLHRGAFGWARKMDKMDAVQRSEWLFHFDTMRKHSEWDVPDLLPDRQPEDDNPCPDASGEHDNGASRLAGLSRLDEEDVRPRFLRSGSSDPDPDLKH